MVAKAEPIPTLDIRQFAPNKWIFLNYGGADYLYYDGRWTIRRAMESPHNGCFFLVSQIENHENALVLIPKEIELAKEAIKILKEQALKGEAMKLYEFITPSDPITFYAPDNDIAEAISLFVGNGKTGIKAADDSETPYTMTVFSGGLKGEQLKRFKETMEKRVDEVIAAGKTFAVCSISQREIYDDHTNNGQDEKRVKKWDDKNRSSLSDWCGYARHLKIKSQP